MESRYIVPITTFFITFLLSFVNLFLVSRNSGNEKKKDILTYITCYSLILLSFIGTIIYTDLLTMIKTNSDDFIHGFSIIEFIVIFAISATIFVLYSLEQTKKFAFISMLLGAGGLYFFIPNDYNILGENTPIILNKLSLVGTFFLLSFMFKYINGLEGNLAIQTFFIGTGLVVISLINATSSLIGLWGACLLGIFLAFYSFNTYPAKLKINNAGANSLGFIIAWILIKNGEESSLGCSIIFGLYFIAEALVALAKRLTLLPKYQNIFANTFSYQANIKGLSVNNINNAIIKISILMTIIGCLQIYAPNPFSIPLFATVVMLWFLNKLSNWDVPRQTLKEMNKSLVEDLKENINEVKKIINKDN